MRMAKRRIARRVGFEKWKELSKDITLQYIPLVNISPNHTSSYLQNIQQ